MRDDPAGGRGGRGAPRKVRGGGVANRECPDRRMRTPSQETFVRRLLRWYRRRGRSLPWRRTTDPYRILVSEVMLQQTQVERVIPKYREFLRRYPSIADLARAHVREVREVWYPLGYNIRPVRLWEIANAVVRRYDGQIPAQRDRLLALKGIGPYTAGAVLAFAYGRRVPVLDTNGGGVLRRVFYARRTPDGVLWRLAARLLPRNAYDFNQALMDFGATLCTARAPQCPACPMRDFCKSYPRRTARRRRVWPAGARGPRAGGRRAIHGGAPRYFAEGQRRFNGQTGQRGLRAVQISRPKKISRKEKADHSSRGMNRIRSCSIFSGSSCPVRPRRWLRRRTWVSTTTPGTP